MVANATTIAGKKENRNIGFAVFRRCFRRKGQNIPFPGQFSRLSLPQIELFVNAFFTFL
jgi:hypothetical protein